MNNQRIVVFATFKKTINIMKLTVLMLVVSLSQIVAAVNAQTIKLNVSAKNETLESVLKQIEKQSDFLFFYNLEEINKDEKISITKKDAGIQDILDAIASKVDLQYTIKDRHIVLTTTVISGNKSQQQTRKVTGRICDTSGEPVIGVNVVVKGSTNGTITDIDGKFSIEVSPDAILQVSYIGYISQEIPVENKNNLAIAIHEDMQKLDEVVVVGYGTQKKLNLTGAVEQVTSEVFENRSVSNATQMLQGSIPNLNIQLTDGKPTRTASYNVRGTTSIGQGGDALVLIDGVEGDPSMLNPNDIASVSVLKDAASAAIYGARGTFGVVLITTKEPTKDKTSVTYTGNFSLQRPATVPDVVTDGYEYASLFYEAYHAWNNYSADPKNINKTQDFSLGWLEDFRLRKEQGITSEVERDANGKYVYYGNADYYGALYKKNTFAQDHNISLSGSNGKLNYYISGRFYGYDGLFRYNTDDYKTMNLRAKGSIQLFDWLKVENNMYVNVFS